MKTHFKILILSICISLLSLSAVQGVSIQDNTYVVFVWTPVSSLLNPRWVDQFEFDSGDVYRAYTTRQAQLTGTWIETPLVELPLISVTWFQAYVEKAEETTTTTTTPATTSAPQVLTRSLLTPQEVKYDINIWGLAYTYSLQFDNPSDPANPFILGFSVLSGNGAYLGADATFWGIAGLGGTGGGGGGTAKFGSISPNTGTQESTLKDVEITATNTTFQDDGVNEVIFSPADGITVSNIRTKDNTTIEVDITIAVDAPLDPKRTVVVSWDDPAKTVSSADVGKYFTVTAKTN